MRSSETVAIGWIDPGHVDSQFALSMLALYRGRANRIPQVMSVESGGLLSRNRNELVANFMRTDVDWLLMIDSDEQLSIEGFDKLIAAANSDSKPIMAGLYFAAWKTGPDIYPSPIPLIYRRNPESAYQPIFDYPHDTVIRIDAAGTGCLLVHRSVFQRIRDEATANEADWCWFRDMPIGGHWFSEDLFFCARAQHLGFTLHAHTGVQLPHRKRYWLTEAHYQQALRGAREVAPA